MRKIALLTVPLLVLGLIALPLAAQEYEDFGVTGTEADTATIVKSDAAGAAPVEEEHTHDHMMTPDDDADDVTHTHAITHTHEYEKKMMMGEGDMMMASVTHTHAIDGHTHAAYSEECSFGRCVVELHHTHPFEVHTHGEGDDAYEHDHKGGSVYHTHAAPEAGINEFAAAGIQLKGSTSVVFGVDLNTNATGFKNTTTAGLKFSFPKRSADRTGAATGQVSAEINLKDFEYTVASDGSTNTTAPTIEAKVNVGEEFSITTFNAIGIDYVSDKAGGAVKTDLKGSGGLELGYQIAPVVLKVGAISRDDWVDDKETYKYEIDQETGEIKKVPVDKGTANLDNSYAFLGTFGLNLDDQDDSDAPDDIELKFSYPHEYPAGEDQLGIGAKAAFDLGDVEPAIMFDGKIPSDDSGIPWDVGGALNWNLLNKSSFNTALGMHIPADGGESTVGATVTLTEAEGRTADNKAKDGEDGGLLGLFAELKFTLEDLTGDANEWMLEVKAHYWDPEGEIKPYFEVGIDSAGEKLPFTAGLELRLVELVTTTLQYASTNLIGADSDKGEVTVGLEIGY